MKDFEVNQRVRVKEDVPGPNRRVPEYARGRTGTVVKKHGVVPNYQHDHADDWGPLYSVILDDDPLFPSKKGKIIIDVHRSWLEGLSGEMPRS